MILYEQLHRLNISSISRNAKCADFLAFKYLYRSKIYLQHLNYVINSIHELPTSRLLRIKHILCDIWIPNKQRIIQLHQAIV